MTQVSKEPTQGMTPENRLTMIGIMLGMFLAALDQTIVSTALPKIIADLKGTDLYAWVTTAYLLASTIAAPIFGRLIELYSRRRILLTAVIIFLVGSALCGLSRNMEELIIFRAIQGIGGGAIFSVALTSIALLFPPRERGKVGGLFGAVFGMSSIVGPWLGGLLTDHISWHWVFYVNMPVGAVAIWFIARYMPPMTPEHKQRFDVLGAILLVFWTVPLMLAFSWAGSTYPWADVHIWGLIATSIVVLMFWIRSQLRGSAPLFDLSILSIRTFSLSAGASFFFGGAFLGAIAFLPLYLQFVKGISATGSGLSLLPLSLGVVTGAISSGQIASRIGKYKPLLIGSGVWLALCYLYLHFALKVDTPMWEITLFMLLLGIGLGPAQSLLTLAAQNNVPRERLGSATSAIQFVRQIGSTIGVALLGTVLSTTIKDEMAQALPASNPTCQTTQKFDVGDLRGGDLNKTLDDQFAQTEKDLLATLQGDKKAYAALQTNCQIPEEFKKNLVEGGIPAQFAQTKTQLIAALNGDSAAFSAVQNSSFIPEEFKKNLVAGGIPAQFNTLKNLSEKAVLGDKIALQTLNSNPQLPEQFKTQVQKLAAAPLPVSAKNQAIAGLKQGLTVAEKQALEQAVAAVNAGLNDKAQQTALDTASSKVKTSLTKAKEELKIKLTAGVNNGITQAEKNIFLYGAVFALCALLFMLVMPNEELKGGNTRAAPSH